MLKVKKGFILRKLGTEYMAVAIGEASKNFNGMIRLNGTGERYDERSSCDKNSGRIRRRDRRYGAS